MFRKLNVGSRIIRSILSLYRWTAYTRMVWSVQHFSPFILLKEDKKSIKKRPNTHWNIFGLTTKAMVLYRIKF